MSYFAALLSRDGGPWQPREIDADGHRDLDALAVAMRRGSRDDTVALLLLEHEDEWFALVRADDGDDPRVFVSHARGAASSAYAEVLGFDPELAEDEPEEPAGDAEVLADQGVPAELLLELAGEDGPDVSDAVSEVAEKAGFGEVLDAMR
ncbi:putative tRNA adenosine deaminase-associated protein [Motilibacter rhizosphaerae]|uniref:Putative tRNA adenosine deaminase-associated protein n=1 Tax=Motilibacter rhizosphaerae TaxID=598652 RepID=A0A4Q7NWQ6_9ACTN|nr:tRNA adenosine deaminase-associated protein [Motilibacter rhizosphaerae]RZS91751.1 putative tRNA adenosine deaminase-associated protein [Motilibacter rhizosphaerae]